MTRRRTFLRGFVLAFAILALVLLVVHTALGAWARHRWSASSALYEKRVGSLDLTSWELPDVPAVRNAATWIAKGAAALVLDRRPGTGPTVPGVVSKAPSEWSPEEVAALRDAITLNRDGLAVLAHARGLEESSFGIPLRQGNEAKLPNLLEIINATKLVFARGNLALLDGDRAAAVQDTTLLGAVAMALQREHALIVQLIGIAVEKYQLRLAHTLVQDPALTAEELKQIEGSVLRGDVRAAFATSVAAGGAAICSEFRETGAGVASGTHTESVPEAFRVLRPVVGDASAAYCLDSYREIAAALDAPSSRLRDRLDRAQKRLDESWGTRLVSKLVLPNLVNASERASVNLELRRLTLAAATLRDRARADGAYPSDLAGLPPGAAPDPEGAGQWTYERLPDGSARLSAPATAALARKTLLAGQPDVLPFEWVLPAPGGGKISR